MCVCTSSCIIATHVRHDLISLTATEKSSLAVVVMVSLKKARSALSREGSPLLMLGETRILAEQCSAKRKSNADSLAAPSCRHYTKTHGNIAPWFWRQSWLGCAKSLLFPARHFIYPFCRTVSFTMYLAGQGLWWSSNIRNLPSQEPQPSFHNSPCHALPQSQSSSHNSPYPPPRPPCLPICPLPTLSLLASLFSQAVWYYLFLWNGSYLSLW